MATRYFRKKPVVIEAVQYALNEYADDPATFRFEGEAPEWLKEARRLGVLIFKLEGEDYWYGYVKTLEGQMRFGPDDWIIKGVNGELYPCKPEVFARTYEEANAECAITAALTPVFEALQNKARAEASEAEDIDDAVMADYASLWLAGLIEELG